MPAAPAPSLSDAVSYALLSNVLGHVTRCNQQKNHFKHNEFNKYKKIIDIMEIIVPQSRFYRMRVAKLVLGCTAILGGRGTSWLLSNSVPCAAWLAQCRLCAPTQFWPGRAVLQEPKGFEEPCQLLLCELVGSILGPWSLF
jgi:hypothetical protein